MEPASELLRAFYSVPAVRARILEFLGGNGSASSCRFLDEPAGDGSWRHLPPAELWNALAAGREVARSLADSRSLLAHLDLEYVDFDDPRRVRSEPDRCFSLQKHIIEALLDELAAAGIEPLHLLTGRGHHLLWRVDAGSEVVSELGELGAVVPCENGATAAAGDHRRLTRAHLGLGRVLELLAHRVLGREARSSPIPLTITAVEVGAGPSGREAISIDLSEYGDPLGERGTRLPFSCYGKWGFRAGAPVLALPVVGGDWPEALRARTDLVAASALAERASAAIPDGTAGTARLLAGYRTSPLSRIHDWHYGGGEAGAEARGDCGRAALELLPPCARRPLERPNDLLLQPAWLQMVTRSLLALGWHPRRIVELVLSRYRGDFGWRPGVHFHDRSLRADFYVRIFTTLFAAGRDDLIDFNCRSTQEKHECPGGTCSLVPFRDSLLARRIHGRLAGRPLDGLFLPHEHSRLPRSCA
jgi:hypothetical protein